MIDQNLLKQVFKDIYFSVYGDDYLFSNKRVDKSITNFISQAPESAGEDWLREFTLFQFEHYSGMKHRFARVYVNWIYGKKAIERWKARTEQQTYYTNKYKRKIGYKKEFKPISIKEFSEAERVRFINVDHDRQLLHCHENFLFDIEICKSCINYEKCSSGNL